MDEDVGGDGVAGRVPGADWTWRNSSSSSSSREIEEGSRGEWGKRRRKTFSSSCKKRSS